jgi:hypothetical protein
MWNIRGNDMKVNALLSKRIGIRGRQRESERVTKE